MIFDRKDTTTIVTQENSSLPEFVTKLQEKYSEIKNDNIVVNLFSLTKLTANDLLEFLEISNQHKKLKKSFVVVTDAIGYNNAPEAISVAPTLQEAFDIIEMEEIERDLGF